MEPSQFGAVQISRNELTYAVFDLIGSEVFILHSKVFPHTHECRSHPCNGPAFMGGRCCATQLPVAPWSRLMGYGAWQHVPGTSHQLTHVLWCQLVLHMLARSIKIIILISPCFTCNSLWDIAPCPYRDNTA